MKKMIPLLVAILFVSLTEAQVDSGVKTVKFEIKDKDTPNPTGLKLPARKKPSLTLPKDKRDPKTNMDIGKTQPQQFDMTKGDGLLLNDKGKVPKAFTKDKEPIPEYAKNQYLGEIKTGSQYVDVKFRDHEYVDGDHIRVFVNEDVVQADVSLTSSFKGFSLALQKGENRIVFQALNQGDSGPNTAELHVYDENGMIISAKEWNLLTGKTATIIVIKE